MPYELYRTLHVLGIALVVMALGGAAVHVVNGGTKGTNAFRKGIAITHGVGLVLLLIAGFGMLAKLGIHGVPGWAIGKLVVWLILGALPVLIYRSEAFARKSWVVVPALVLVATAMALFRASFPSSTPAIEPTSPPPAVTVTPAV